MNPHSTHVLCETGMSAIGFGLKGFAILVVSFNADFVFQRGAGRFKLSVNSEIGIIPLLVHA